MRVRSSPKTATVIRYACGLSIGVGIATGWLALGTDSHPAESPWVLALGAAFGLALATVPGSAPKGELPVEVDDWIFHVLGAAGLVEIAVLWNAV